MAKAGPDPDAQKAASGDHDVDSAVDDADRVAERAREGSPGVLGRVWRRLRLTFGRE
jgi:hypothetical protein